jgi:hypothetical protein
MPEPLRALRPVCCLCRSRIVSARRRRQSDRKIIVTAENADVGDADRVDA